MPHYIDLIHKETDSSYGVSFPALPGIVTLADPLHEAMHIAAPVQPIAAED